MSEPTPGSSPPSDRRDASHPIPSSDPLAGTMNPPGSVAPPHTVPRPPASRGLFGSLLRWLLQGIGLGLGGGVALLVGILLAYFSIGTSRFPVPPVEAVPPLEWLLRSIDRMKTAFQPNPDRTSEAQLTPKSPPPSLTPEERQALQTQLTALQTELEQLAQQTQTLEQELGQGEQSSRASLEDRIQQLSRSLNPDLARSAPKSSPPTSVQEDLHVTLPSDMLFAVGESQLRPEGEVILKAVLSDLQAYPGQTIRVTAFTDNVGNSNVNRELSLRQAQALQTYLSQRLSDHYTWVTLGYGDSQPIAPNDSDSNRQRNRRVEITVSSGG